MSTPLDPPVNPGSKKDKALEMERLQDEFDLRTGKKSIPSPWHRESKLSKGKQQALDAQEPKEKKSGGFFKESPEMAAKQKEFDEALKDIKSPDSTWQPNPVTPEERLRSWHRALGTPSHIVEQEVAELKQRQEAKKR